MPTQGSNLLSLSMFVPTSPCGITATGEDSFYITNHIKFEFKVEFLHRLSLGNVGYYDGTRGHILLAGRSIPIGINTSPDGKYVYMTELGGKRISIYIRESGQHFDTDPGGSASNIRRLRRC
ncbi:hypothetical protein LSAT2_014189 [Lamellibrachia satsuma]|nr:hypothetical protein LSAT2_014189 [Lamellibrachia satsuma]